MKIAVIGAGIAGITAARELSRSHDVHLFESSDYVGGHAHGVDVDQGGSIRSANTGFLVFNQASYPAFSKLLRELQVPVQSVAVDFAVRSEQTGLEYRGGSWRGLLADRQNLLFPSYYTLLRDLLRFNRQARRLAIGEDSEVSFVDFLTQGRYSQSFTCNYLFPLVRATWPLDTDRLLQIPATYVIAFLNNFGLLQLRDRPRNMTVVGGSRSYVEKLVAPFRDRIHLNCPVASVHRNPEYVILKFAHRPRLRFDLVVLATHADQALGLLADACRAEKQVLSTFDYQVHRAVLHHDASVVPHRQKAAACWNYFVRSEGRCTVMLTYDLARLGHAAPARPLFLTLHDNGYVDPSKITGQYAYLRPAFSRDAIGAQRRFAEINGKYRTFFCGSYWRYGFHEDAVISAQAVANLVRK